MISVKERRKKKIILVRNHFNPYFCNPVYKGSGRSVARLSRLLWEQEVASSNLAAPTEEVSANAETFFALSRPDFDREGRNHIRF
jgi:hypothetical protein